MPLDKVFRTVVKTADKIFKPVQEDVIHQTWVGGDGYGTDYPRVDVVRKALVTQAIQGVQLQDGTTVQTKAYLVFLAPITPNGATGRTEPIDPNDRFVLADGTVGESIPNVKGLRKGTPFLLEVWLK
jgi:hypothetical protein